MLYKKKVSEFPKNSEIKAFVAPFKIAPHY